MAAAQICSFLRHVAKAQRRRSQKRAALSMIGEHITHVKEELLKPHAKDDVKRTILDELRDRITGIIIDEKLLSDRQQQDEHTIQLLRARLEQLESQLAMQDGHLEGIEKSEHDEHELFEQVLHDIEGKLTKSADEVMHVEERKEILVKKLAHKEDVRKKKIEEITRTLRRIEEEHSRLSKRKDVDQKQVTRLARMINKHKKAIEKI